MVSCQDGWLDVPFKVVVSINEAENSMWRSVTAFALQFSVTKRTKTNDKLTFNSFKWSSDDYTGEIKL